MMISAVTIVTGPADAACPPQSNAPGWVMLEQQRGWMGGPIYAAHLLTPWRRAGWRAVFDAGDQAGRALMALEQPFAAIIFTGDPRMADKLMALGRAKDVAVVASLAALG